MYIEHIFLLSYSTSYRFANGSFHDGKKIRIRDYIGTPAFYSFSPTPAGIRWWKKRAPRAVQLKNDKNFVIFASVRSLEKQLPL